jgi:CheY-like chemotaxis protein
MEDDMVSCKEAGFNEHLTKPNFQNLDLTLRRLGGQGPQNSG